MEQILNLPEGKECLAIGTVYKEMKLKPNVLSEYTKVCRQCLLLPSRATFEPGVSVLELCVCARSTGLEFEPELSESAS